MTSTHIDQLAEWWENAETGPASQGDLVIKRHPDGRYTIREAEKGWENTNYRILARAPKPKPAWHDAVAVMAHTDDMTRRLWARAVGDQWEDIDGYTALTDDLRNVTPLIEAKVTDKMVDRGCQAHLRRDHNDTFRETYRKSLHAALGLETT